MTDKEPIDKVLKNDGDAESQSLNGDGSGAATAESILKQMNFIGEKITDGAISFLTQEYTYLGIFSVVFAIILGVTVDMQEMKNDPPTNFPYTATAFIIGSLTSIAAGYIGMRIAVYSNTRTTFQCCRDTNSGFLTAFRGGQVLGFILVGLALLVLEFILIVYKASWFDAQLEIISSSDDDDATKS